MAQQKQEVTLQRRATSTTHSKQKKKVLPVPVDDVPLNSKASKKKKVASSRFLKPGLCEESGSLLDQVSAIMGTPQKKSKSKAAAATKSSVRQTDESQGADQPMPSRKANKKRNINNIPPPPPPPPPAGTPPKSAATKATDFLQSLEAANQDRKQQQQQTKRGKKKKPLKKKLSAAQRRDIQKDMAKRKAKRHNDVVVHIEDENIEEVGWFTLAVKENSSASLGYTPEDCHSEDQPKKKKKKKKELRSTVDYSRDYKFTTRQVMEEKPAGYYQTMVGIKRRQFHIDNLFTARPLVPRVYHHDVDLLNEIVDRREDKWWIKSRLPLYQEEDSELEEDEEGMEVLNAYFGANPIDHDPDNDDDDADIFSIASVESVHFSDDDDNQDTYNGKLREKVEVMPGDFKMLRKEEETYEAITNGTYMSSLCLGCGVALVSVQDAREVACPTCGSITPLNGVCLHKPFGIATGIKRIKVEHMLAPRKSPFVAAPSKGGANKSIDIPKSVTTTTTASNKPARPNAAASRNNNNAAAMGQEQRKMKGAAATNVNTSTSIRKAAVGKTGSSGLKVRPSSSKAVSSRGPKPSGKSAKTKSRPTTKPGAVRVAAR